MSNSEVMAVFNKILIPSDGSDYALHAVSYGVDIAKRYQSQVDIVYVVVMPPSIGTRLSSDNHEHIHKELVLQGEEALEKTREMFDDAGLQVNTQIIIGSAVPSILNLARDGRYDLIVIGSRGAGTAAIDQILIGSVAEGILHGAPCPVLMIRPAA